MPARETRETKVLTGANVASDVTAQPTSVKGVFSAVMTRAYLRVPELTTPMKNSKTAGSH